MLILTIWTDYELIQVGERSDANVATRRGILDLELASAGILGDLPFDNYQQYF